MGQRQSVRSQTTFDDKFRAATRGGGGVIFSFNGHFQIAERLAFTRMVRRIAGRGGGRCLLQRSLVVKSIKTGRSSLNSSVGCPRQILQRSSSSAVSGTAAGPGQPDGPPPPEHAQIVLLFLGRRPGQRVGQSCLCRIKQAWAK